MTRASIYEGCLDDDLDAYRVVLDSLTDDFDVVQVALAALKMAHTASSPEMDSRDIPQPDLHDPDRDRGRDRDRGKGRDRGKERHTGKDRPWSKDGPDGRGDKKERGKRGGGSPASGTKRIYVNSGRAAGVRPQDLVGAIAGETGLSGRDIGAIQISDRFATVEVPSGAAKDVIRALNSTRLKGNRVKARLDRH
jgi:ATP-dependent RNA helicase DeaD